jgi:hypothetical protein
MPPRAAAEAHHFSLGDERTLRTLFEAIGFREIEATREVRHFTFPSFDAFFDPIEEGVGYMGQEFITLPLEVRWQVREDLRSDFEGLRRPGGPATQSSAPASAFSVSQAGGLEQVSASYAYNFVFLPWTITLQSSASYPTNPPPS